MGRNSSGTYTLPTGNPVTTGTTITSTWANATFTDVATELTSSLDRAGRGAMTGQLQAIAGTAAAPGITFDGDANTGIHRPAADKMRVAAGGVDVLEVTTTEATTLKQVKAIDGTAAAPAYSFTTEASSGMRLEAAGDLRLTVQGTDALTISASTGEATIVPGTTIVKKLKLNGTNPASTAGLTNTMTPYLVPKAAGYITTDGAGNVTVASGQNIASVTIPGSNNGIEITFATAMADTNYVVVSTPTGGTTATCHPVENRGAGTASKIFLNTNGASGAALNPATTALTVQFVIFGAQ